MTPRRGSLGIVAACGAVAMLGLALGVAQAAPVATDGAQSVAVPSMVDRLLGLERLSLSGAGVDLAFEHAMPTWAWASAIAGAIVLAAWSYRRLLGPRGARVALAGLRSLTIVLLLMMLAGPRLVRPNDRVEKDWVVLLADRSASMAVADAPNPDGTRTTRDAQARAILDQAGPTLASLARDRNLMVLGFDASAFPVETREAEGGLRIELPEAVGVRTSLDGALRQGLARVAGRPLAGVVVLSDGRTPEPPSRGVMRELDQRRAPVFTVPLGSPTPLIDVAIAGVEAPGAGFVDDLIPVVVRLDARGRGEGASIPTGRVELINDRGRVAQSIDLASLSWTADGARATLVGRAESAGEASWTVRVALDAPDLSPENDQAIVALNLSDRPIRVAYFDGYPRWEYRYLRGLLVRERSIRSSVMMLSATRRFIQEGSDPLDAVPRSVSDWSGIDVVILGDLRPSLFSQEQLEAVRRVVVERGAGLLWIGGSGATPGAWRGTPLADLLPFVADSRDGGSVATWPGPVTLRPGPAASRLGVLQLGPSPSEPWPEALSDASLGWPQLHGVQRIDAAALKPTAEVIALAVPSTDTGGPSPAVMTMRVGAGRVVYVATDEIWRYRFGRGEVLYERFWLPLIRLLARESLARTGAPAVLSASPDRPQTGQGVQVVLRLLDQGLVDARPDRATVRIEREGVPGPVAQVVLTPQQPAGGDALLATFSGSWVPGEPGVYVVRAEDALLSGLDVRARVEVAAPEDERRRPETDHPLLAQLASDTGAAVLTPADLSRLPELLPNRQVSVPGVPEVETLWDKPMVWILLMFLLTAEWVGRRLIKLP